MTYPELRAKAKSGDVILLEGNGFVSKIIRAATGQSISHIAVLVWLADGLFIAEMVEGVGFQLSPASQRIPALKGIVYFGAAPKVVQDQHGKVVQCVIGYRADKKKQKYGYASLLKVWWAQLWHKEYKTRQKVCSTFVQEIWECCGFNFAQTADPGDYVGLCQYISKVER